MVRTVSHSAFLGILFTFAFYVQDVRAAEDSPVAAGDEVLPRTELDAALRAEIADPVQVAVARDGDAVLLTVTRGADVRKRTLSLADVPADRRARVLALAAADLLRDMPRLPPEPAAVPPKTPDTAPVPTAKPALVERGLEWEGQIGGFVRAVPATSTYLGAAGKVAVCTHAFCPYLALALGSANTQTNLGSVSATLFRAGAGVDLSVRPLPWLLLATGPSVHAGTFGASSVARAGAKSESFTAASLDMKWTGQVAFRTGYMVWLFAEAGAGGTAFGGTALVNRFEQASDRGFFVEASVGLHFAGDR